MQTPIRLFLHVLLVTGLTLAVGCGDSSTVEDTIIACQDGLDNDKNGLTDCKDPGCGKHSFCDPSVTKSCGDGVVTDPERCDTKIASGQTGACPTSCDDGNACTKDSLGNPGTCMAACVAIPITSCEGGDGCCPTGCDANKDSDCSASCGNGALEPKETCDTAIPAGQAGACPTAASCDDGNACTIDALLNGGTCGASCGHQAMILCIADKSDGCCPTGCNAATDMDCSPSCGNGVVEPKETCDTKLGSGQVGVCPTVETCNDGNACTVDSLLNGGTCTASCTHAPISQCSTTSDGCCPTGCNAATDVDCSASCGNGVLEPKETCDTTIPAGQAGACPTNCNDADFCTVDTLINGGGCNASCSSVAITQCKSGDGCCPTGCNWGNDGDCPPACGNGILEPGETCDTTIPAGQTGACPTLASCDDKNACTVDTLTAGGTCTAGCAHGAITTCQGGDGCCPPTCTGSNDSDCGSVCGNGIVESDEACDTGIASGVTGACPTSCVSSDPCSSAPLYNAGTCQAKCGAFTAISTCSGESSDGCCPIGCYYNSDIDCLCGNGVLDAGETCEIFATTFKAPGGMMPRTSTPSSCPTEQFCQYMYEGCGHVVNAGTCTATCTMITTCGPSDGCCPYSRECGCGDDPDCGC